MKNDNKSFVVSARVDVRSFATILLTLDEHKEGNEDITRSSIVGAAVDMLATMLVERGIRPKPLTFEEAYQILRLYGFTSNKDQGQKKIMDLLRKESVMKNILETTEETEAEFIMRQKIEEARAKGLSKAPRRRKRKKS